ncbi:MAG: hypothetical protein IKS43_05985 [Clostridia bacterium]|nr:hypothetical protein [Clostridia bacterium]
MKEKTAYLRGLMDGMKLPDDDNTKLFRAIADCLDALADEIETESARTDILEGEVEQINDDIDELDEVLGMLLEEEDEDESADEDSDWEDDFDYFTCPECGEIVPLNDEMLSEESDPICPNCNAKLFGDN